MARTRSRGPPQYNALGKTNYMRSDTCKRHRLPDRARKSVSVTTYRRRKPKK